MPFNKGESDNPKGRTPGSGKWRGILGIAAGRVEEMEQVKTRLEASKTH